MRNQEALVALGETEADKKIDPADHLPFACLICREPWHAGSCPVINPSLTTPEPPYNPFLPLKTPYGPLKIPLNPLQVMTKCEHYFCERCAIEHFQKSRRCFACSEQTGGIFNKAKPIQEKIDRLKVAEEVASAEDMTQEQLVAEYEASKEAQKRRGFTGGWAMR